MRKDRAFPAPSAPPERHSTPRDRLETAQPATLAPYTPVQDDFAANWRTLNGTRQRIRIRQLLCSGFIPSPPPHRRYILAQRFKYITNPRQPLKFKRERLTYKEKLTFNNNSQIDSFSSLNSQQNSTANFMWNLEKTAPERRLSGKSKSRLPSPEILNDSNSGDTLTRSPISSSGLSAFSLVGREPDVDYVGDASPSHPSEFHSPSRSNSFEKEARADVHGRLLQVSYLSL